MEQFQRLRYNKTIKANPGGVNMEIEGAIQIRVIPKIKGPLKEKNIVKLILWTIYHIHARQGPCRYVRSYALTAKCDMEVSKRNATALLSISRELPILKNEVLDASPLYWNEDFVKAVDALRVKKILKNLKIFSPRKTPG